MKLAYAEQSFTFTDFWLIRKILDFISKLDWRPNNIVYRLSFMEKCITKHVGIKGQKAKSLWGVFDHHHWLWHFVKKSSDSISNGQLPFSQHCKAKCYPGEDYWLGHLSCVCLLLYCQMIFFQHFLPFFAKTYINGWQGKKGRRRSWEVLFRF